MPRLSAGPLWLLLLTASVNLRFADSLQRPLGKRGAATQLNLFGRKNWFQNKDEEASEQPKLAQEPDKKDVIYLDPSGDEKEETALAVEEPKEIEDAAALRLLKMDIEVGRERNEQLRTLLVAEEQIVQSEREIVRLKRERYAIERQIAAEYRELFLHGSGKTAVAEQMLAKECYQLRANTLSELQKLSAKEPSDEEALLLLKLCYRLVVILSKHDKDAARALRAELRIKNIPVGMAYLDEEEKEKELKLVEVAQEYLDLNMGDVVFWDRGIPSQATYNSCSLASVAAAQSETEDDDGEGRDDRTLASQNENALLSWWREAWDSWSGGEKVVETAPPTPKVQPESSSNPVVLTASVANLTDEQLLPFWVPDSLVELRSINAMRKGDIPSVSQKDVDLFVSEVCGPRFKVSEKEFSPFFVLLRGKLLNVYSSSPEGSSAAATEEMRQAFYSIDNGGLADRLQMIVLPEPPTAEEWKSVTTPNAPQSLPFEFGGDDRNPAVLILPQEISPARPGIGAYLLTFLSSLAAVATIALFSSVVYSDNEVWMAQLTKEDPRAGEAFFSLFAGLSATLFMHDAMHSLAAARWGVKLAPPVQLPALSLQTPTPTFGSITRFAELPPNRKSIVDVALAGPLCGMITSLLLAAFGIMQQSASGLEDFLNYPVVPAGVLHTSLPISGLAALLDSSGELIRKPVIDRIRMHPSLLAGCVGVLVNAMNLIPVGRLDGNRALGAAFGRNVAQISTLVGLGVMGFSGFFDTSETSSAIGSSQLLLNWAIVVMLFQRGPDVPALDEISSVGSVRKALSLGSVAFAILCFVPFPDVSGILY